MSCRQRTTPEMHPNGDGSASFRVPYDASWVASVKAMVPAHAFVDEPFVEVIVRLTRRIFGSCSGPGASTNSHGGASSDPWQTLHLRESAPIELVETAYRCLAKLAHPDRGGTDDSMRAITIARDALKARVS